MHQETELLVNAIESLQHDSSLFKDYLFPIASALFTSLLGAGIAYFTLRYQESIQIEKEKMNTTNKWTLLAEEARSTLISIKGNYNEKLSDNPFQRISAIPSILFHATPIIEKYEELSFIIPKSGSKLSDAEKWSQIFRIRTMISNYNYVLELWNQRNEIERPIKLKIMKQAKGQAFVNMNQIELIDLIGASEISVLIDLTERVVKLTDDLIIETDDFLEKFPAYAKTLVNTDRLKKYGSVLKYSNNGNERFLNLIKRVSEVDYTYLEDLFGQSAEELKKGHLTGYEV
jgi:hypothetical protein